VFTLVPVDGCPDEELQVPEKWASTWIRDGTCVFAASVDTGASSTSVAAIASASGNEIVIWTQALEDADTPALIHLQGLVQAASDLSPIINEGDVIGPMTISRIYNADGRRILWGSLRQQVTSEVKIHIRTDWMFDDVDESFSLNPEYTAGALKA